MSAAEERRPIIIISSGLIAGAQVLGATARQRRPTRRQQLPGKVRGVHASISLTLGDERHSDDHGLRYEV